MTEDETRDDGRYITIATKIATNAAAMLERCLAEKGMTIYEALQACANMLIHQFDTPHGLTDQEMQMRDRMNEILRHGLLRLTDPKSMDTMQWSEATYYATDPTGRSKGVQACMVQQPLMDQPTISWNKDEILERAVCLLFPTLYRDLRELGNDMQCSTVAQLLAKMAILMRDSQIRYTIEELMADNQRHEYGRQAIPGVKYRRKMHRGIDSPGLFDNMDDDDGSE